MLQRYSNVSEVPLALAVFLASDYYDYNDDPYTISATTLLKPLRQIILPTRVPETMGLTTLADMMSNRLGAAVHDGIQRAWETNHKTAMLALGYPKQVVDRIRINPKPEELTNDILPVYLEQRLSKKLGKWTITGKFDFIGEGRVQDFKTASVWSYKNQVNADKQTLQGSLYRWLDPQKITQDEMDIHHIFMDWRAGMVKTDPNYPPRRFHKQTFPLLSLQETEAYIRRKLSTIEQHWETPEDQLPQCDDEELWRSEAVFKYYKGGVVTTRSTKNFPTRQEAMLRFIEDGSKGLVREVPGEVKACKYCAAFPICTQKDALVAAGDLVL